MIYAEIQQVLGGHPAPRPKRVYVDSAVSVRNITVDY